MAEGNAIAPASQADINRISDYVSDEVAIGKWQGATLYRKIFQGNCPTGEKTNFADLRSLNISYIVKIEGSAYVTIGSNTDIVMVNSYYNDGNFLFVDYLNGYLRTNCAGFSGYLNVVVYYTKSS